MPMHLLRRLEDGKHIDEPEELRLEAIIGQSTGDELVRPEFRGKRARLRAARCRKQRSADFPSVLFASSCDARGAFPLPYLSGVRSPDHVDLQCRRLSILGNGKAPRMKS